MIAHDFQYEAPHKVEDALEILARFGDGAAVLGGGTWLVPNMTYGRDRPSLVLDAKNLGFDHVTEEGTELIIGSRVTYAQIIASTSARASTPLLATMAKQITGGPQIVGHGTIGGSACYGNPSSDAPACLVALSATLCLRSAKETRHIPAADFFRAPFATARRVDELLTAIRIPLSSPSAISGYCKLKFSTGSWPIVTAACIGSPVGTHGMRFRIAVGGANEVPFAYETTVQMVPSESDISAIAQAACDLVTQEWSDEFAGPGYRREVTPAVVRRSIRMSMAGYAP
jgi:aerobic carbon-monoxide dehydrogenase medium subunit